MLRRTSLLLEDHQLSETFRLCCLAHHLRSEPMPMPPVDWSDHIADHQLWREKLSGRRPFG